MVTLLRIFVLMTALLLASTHAITAAEPVILDDFERLDGWHVVNTEGVHFEVAHDEGVHGMGIRLDFDFGSGAGYALVRKELPVDLPPNYEFSFQMRADAPNNNFEYKLVDPSNKNVWWLHERNYEFPRDWQKFTIKKRHLQFAWGPAGGGDIEKVAAIEIAIAAGTGGKGSIWLDDLALEQKQPVHDYQMTPVVEASTTAENHNPGSVIDDDEYTEWRSGVIADDQWLQIDFQRQRVYGALELNWNSEDYAIDYQVQTSNDGLRWQTIDEVHDSNGGRDYIYMPDTESRYLRLNLLSSSQQNGYAIRSIDVKPYDYSVTTNRFFESMAKDSPKGRFPKYFSGKQTYWTVIGARGDEKEALMNQEGAIEVDQNQFSIEPFLYLDGKLVTWNDVELEQSLEEGYLPVPSVSWHTKDLKLTITASAAGEPGKSSLYARYRLESSSEQSRHAKLYLAIRPFQVNPPWQSLNHEGGVAPIHSISKIADGFRINDDKTVRALTPPSGFGAATFYQGGITEYLAEGRLPAQDTAVDAFGYASAALEYDFDLTPGSTRDMYITVPFHEDPQSILTQGSVQNNRPLPDPKKIFARSIDDWRAILDRASISMHSGSQQISNTLKTTIAYILINLDGPAIQPGSRSYERSWIRDGALTSTALLQMGYTEEVRDFIQWFAEHQFDSGKVPCCVDYRGADPIPEHDSNGAFIYLVMEYYRFTRDVGFAREMWPRIVKAVDYIDTLRQQRLTDEYMADDKAAYYGLVPESISHEGYAANPVHSYWDNFFVMRGLMDAADLAEILGERQAAINYGRIRDEFQQHLLDSMQHTIAMHQIDYLPGSVELGDFDAPSTAISVVPGGQLSKLPADILNGTFDKFYRYFEGRRSGSVEWTNYSPYEARLMGTYIRLGENVRAHQILDFLLKDQRPMGWNQWAEIVWRDSDAPNYIGDMPHTWVGSEFIRAIRSMFVYERDADKALVISSGLTSDWVENSGGVSVKRLPTYYGTLNYQLYSPAEDTLQLSLSGDISVPPGKIIIESPLDRPLTAVTLNGESVDTFTKDTIVLDTFPATLDLHY